MVAHFVSEGINGSRSETYEQRMDYEAGFAFVTQFYRRKNQLYASEAFKSGILMATVTELPRSVLVLLGHAIQSLSQFSIENAFAETERFGAHLLKIVNVFRS